MSTTLFVGDDYSVSVTLGTVDANGNFTAISVPLSATVRAALISATKTVLIAATAQSSGSEGADWVNGVVEVVFANSETGSIAPNTRCFLEIEIDDSGTLSTFQSDVDIIVREAFIS